MSARVTLSPAQARLRQHLAAANARAGQLYPPTGPRARQLTAAESRRAELAQRSPIQQQIDRRPRCCYCHAVLTARDLADYHAEGGNGWPASCTSCAEGP